MKFPIWFVALVQWWWWAHAPNGYVPVVIICKCVINVLCKSSHKVISDTHSELLIRTPNKANAEARQAKPSQARWIWYSVLGINSTWNRLICVPFCSLMFFSWIANSAIISVSSDWKCYQQSISIQPHPKHPWTQFSFVHSRNRSKHLHNVPEEHSVCHLFWVW